MQALENLTHQEASAVQFLLTDVDDTITTEGKLRPVALEALYRLKDAGIRTICVTGGLLGGVIPICANGRWKRCSARAGLFACIVRVGRSRSMSIHPSCRKDMLNALML